MNSGAPASTAPPDFSSLGMIVSQRSMSMAYCEAEKYFGVYAPAGAAAFSLCTIWWTYSAASAGMTFRTEPAAETARVRRMSRRLMDSLGMCVPHRKEQTEALLLQIPFLGFVKKIFGGAPGERHNRERRILVRVGDQRRAIRNKQILHVVGLAETIEHRRFRIGAHARGADFVNNLAACLNPERIFAMDGSFGAVFATHGFDDGAKRLLHVLGL